jgi:hypothetical protein
VVGAVGTFWMTHHCVDRSITRAHGGLERKVLGGNTQINTSNDAFIETLILNNDS